MLFNSISFVVFFPIVLVPYWLFNKKLKFIEYLKTQNLKF